MPTQYEKLIQDNLLEAFKRPLAELERSLGAKRDGISLVFPAFGRMCRIDAEQVSLSDSPVLDPKGLIISLYARHAVPRKIQCEPFAAYKEFDGTMPYQGAFSANSECVLIPHVPMIQKKAGLIKEAFGGRNGDSGDFSLVLYPLPKIALCYVFYLSDEEFPASATVLFSANARTFMPLDGLADVAEYTSKEIIQLAGR